MLPKIIIPSRGRANCVKTTKVVNNAILCVSESQEASYRKFNPDTEIVVHPEELEVPGPLCRKWAWMYEHFGRHVFFLDDDVVACRKMYWTKGEPLSVTPEVATELIYNASDIAEQMGCYIYGFNNNGDTRNYNGLRPFRLRGLCWANGLGIRPGSKIWWNTEYTIFDDWWIHLINKYHHRFSFFDDRFCFAAEKTFSNAGGVSAIRTGATYEKDFKLLKADFGDAIQPKKGTPRAPVRNPWQPSLNIGF
jgi:hypothetical protein